MNKKLKGGYQIVDLGGVDLLDVSPELDSSLQVFTTIRESKGKPVLITGINFDGYHPNDVFVQPKPIVIDGEDCFQFELYGYKVAIEPDNVILHVEEIKSLKLYKHTTKVTATGGVSEIYTITKDPDKFNTVALGWQSALKMYGMYQGALFEILSASGNYFKLNSDSSITQITISAVTEDVVDEYI